MESEATKGTAKHQRKKAKQLNDRPVTGMQAINDVVPVAPSRAAPLALEDKPASESAGFSRALPAQACMAAVGNVDALDTVASIGEAVAVGVESIARAVQA